MNVNRMLQELSEEIRQLTTELKKTGALLAAERFESIDKALAHRYLLLCADQVDEKLPETLEYMVLKDCQKRDQCKQHFEKSLRGLLEYYREGDAEATIRKLNTETSGWKMPSREEQILHVSCAIRSFRKRSKSKRWLSGNLLVPRAPSVEDSRVPLMYLT